MTDIRIPRPAECDRLAVHAPPQLAGLNSSASAGCDFARFSSAKRRIYDE